MTGKDEETDSSASLRMTAGGGFFTSFRMTGKDEETDSSASLRMTGKDEETDSSASLRMTAGERVRSCRPERSRRTRPPVIAGGNDAACGRQGGDGFFTSFRMTGKDERADSSASSARFAPRPRWGPADRAGELRSEAQAMPFGGLRFAQNDGGLNCYVCSAGNLPAAPVPSPTGGTLTAANPDLQKTDARGKLHVRLLYCADGGNAVGRCGSVGLFEERAGFGGCERKFRKPHHSVLTEVVVGWISEVING